MENNTETYTSLINKLWELHCLHYLLVWLIYTCYKPIARKKTFYSKQKRSIIKVLPRRKSDISDASPRTTSIRCQL